ncbi:MAG: hypothetical protein DRO07_01725 [Candidatus Iainarchaeum archaeon]|uniref:Uncharacterized protein n=1 Tax=Candidatus Iainarchaeum sp. TaxID=3101447 RepID=A0A497JIX5_9ARCH|nr:MAG: hypothetical protein DRO07_01725 [Candidatus Diapherotrites archaeon]
MVAKQKISLEGLYYKVQKMEKEIAELRSLLSTQQFTKEGKRQKVCKIIDEVKRRGKLNRDQVLALFQHSFTRQYAIELMQLASKNGGLVLLPGGGKKQTVLIDTTKKPHMLAFGAVHEEFLKKPKGSELSIKGVIRRFNLTHEQTVMFIKAMLRTGRYRILSPKTQRGLTFEEADFLAGDWRIRRLK